MWLFDLFKSKRAIENKKEIKHLKRLLKRKKKEYELLKYDDLYGALVAKTHIKHLKLMIRVLEGRD